MVLSIPSQVFFNTYKRIILDFLWQGKKSVVRYQKIIQDYHLGGLKLVDLQAKCTALHAKWPLYFRERDEPWLYPVQIDHRIWQCNLNVVDMKRLCAKYKALPVFEDISKAWAQIFFQEPDNFNEICEQKIWYNSLLRRAGLPISKKVFRKSFFDTLYQIRHKTEQRLLTYAEFCEIYGNILSVLDFNGLISAIPINWRLQLKENEPLLNEFTKYEKIENKKYPVREFYWSLIQKNETPGKRVWEQDLKTNLESLDNEWDNEFIKCFAFTNSVKLRSFYYRLINRYVVTNLHLSKYQDRTSVCTFCKETDETITHLFYYCIKVQALWRNLRKWIKYYLNVDLEIEEKMVFFQTYEGIYCNLVNLFILILKR